MVVEDSRERVGAFLQVADFLEEGNDAQVAGQMFATTFTAGTLPKPEDSEDVAGGARHADDVAAMASGPKRSMAALRRRKRFSVSLAERAEAVGADRLLIGD